VAPKIRVLVAGEARLFTEMLRHTAAVEAAALAVLAAMALSGRALINALEVLGARVF